MSNKFVLKLIVNNKKKEAIVVKDRSEAQREAAKIEGVELFWIGNKAYGKINSYRIAAELIG